MSEKLIEKAGLRKDWYINKYASQADFEAGIPYAEEHFEENLLLTEGITVALNLIGGITATAFSNANAFLGVGDSSAAESVGQTDLQASTNKTYKAMEATYPQVSVNVITWRAVFGSADANYAWNEFTVANGSSGSATNLNRKVSSQGTKASGQIWTLDLQMTLA